MYAILFFFIMDFKNIKDFIIKGLRFARDSIIAAGLTAFVLFPFYLSTTGSAYAQVDDGTASLSNWFVPITKLIANYYTGHAMRAVTSDNSQTASYCGLIMLFVIPLYLMNRKVAKITKIKKIILLALLFLATDNEMLNYILHGFHFQTLAPNRFTAFIIFLLICILADIFSNISQYKEKAVTFLAFLTSPAP